MSEQRPADTTAPPPGAPAVGGIGGDWPAQAADTIVRVVGQVRDRTTGPAITAARGIVYGILAGILGVVCLVLLTIGSVRALDTALRNWVGGEDHTWLAHLIVSLPFTVLGLVLWSRRRPPDES